MFNTKVATSFANGTIINLDANDALNFIVGLSITIINTIGTTVEREARFGRKVSVSCDADTMYMIKHYNSGIPEAIYSCIIQTNADILLKFVQDVVLNDSTRGLYLFYHQSNTRNGGEAPYDLVVRALEEVHQYFMLHGSDSYRADESQHFDRYNDDFIKLIHRTQYLSMNTTVFK